MTMKVAITTIATLLACALLSTPLAAQPASTPGVYLPLERTVYFIGESIPVVAVHVPKTFRLTLVDAAGRVAVAGQPGSATNWRLETARLAAGRYTFVLDTVPTTTTITLATPRRASSAAMMEETMPDTSTPEKQARVATLLAETGVNAIMATGVNEPGQFNQHDLFAPTGTMIFFNPYTRPMSFSPARIYAPELETFRHRLVLNAQANGRYPTYGGYYYDWDAAGPFSRSGLLIYWGWGNQTQALRNYITRADQAVYAEFTRRTGLQPVTSQEYLQYCLAIGRPEFAPAFDLPTYHWITALSKTAQSFTPEQREAFEQRLDAWSRYLMGIYAESYAGHQAVLRETIPSLRNTASMNADHCPVRMGQWHPDANPVLDFTFMTAWNDQIAGPDFTFQWLFDAAILDINRRHDQPTWIASSLGVTHGLANYPGKFLRMAGHNLAYGGQGLGFALEGFSNVMGGMNRDTNWEQIKGKAGGEDLIAGREFLKRFAPLSASCSEVRQVGILFSRYQLGRQHLSHGMDTPQYNAFITLARLGYTPRYLTEDQLLQGGLTGMKTLVVVNQSVPLPEPVLAKLRAFTAAGGRILRDKSSTVALPGMALMDITMPYANPGKPHNWSAPNITDIPHAVVNEQRYAELAPGMLAALGDAARTPLIPKAGPTAKVSTFQLDGGPEATYVVAVNDNIVDNQANWVRTTVELAPNGITKGALYDLTTEQSLGTVAPVSCAFDNLTVRLYGLLARPVSAIGLKATQQVTAGSELRLQVQFLGADRKALQASIPFHLTLTRPDGSLAQEYYRATDRQGNFTLAYPLAANEAPGAWQVAVRSLLDGMTATVPVTVSAGKPLAFTPITDNVVVRGGAQLAAFLAKKPALTLPLFDNPLGIETLTPVANAARETLAKQGITVNIAVKPEIATYTMGYDPDEEALAANARAERGEVIGKIKVTTINRNDYFGTIGGYIYGKPVLLLELVGLQDGNGKPASDNPLAEHLDAAGMLWPKSTAAFPGPGKATVQLVKSAFKLGVDAIVIQASDPAGLLTGVQALTKLPADWLTPSVEGARRTLLQEFNIGPAPAQTLMTKGLTANGLVAGKAPQPLALRFPDAMPPLLAEVKPFTPAPVPVRAVPAEIAAKDLIPQYQLGAHYTRCSTPGGNWPGDCRFQDAVLVKVDAGAGGAFTVTLDGTFRYNDRQPMSQSSWEELLAMYNALPKTRQPATFEVWIDGKPAGSLGTLTTGEKEVPVQHNPPQSAREEVVTRISGQVQLPAGVHDVLLIHRNIVDGVIAKVTFAQ